MEQAADAAQCDGLRKKLFEALSDLCSESQGLRISLEKLSFPPNSHDYLNCYVVELRRLTH